MGLQLSLRMCDVFGCVLVVHVYGLPERVYRDAWPNTCFTLAVCRELERPKYRDHECPQRTLGNVEIASRPSLTVEHIGGPEMVMSSWFGVLDMARRYFADPQARLLQALVQTNLDTPPLTHRPPT